jgi:DNA-binding MarR family transcriptional regulator
MRMLAMDRGEMFQDREAAPARTLVVSERDVRAAQRLLGLIVEGEHSEAGLEHPTAPTRAADTSSAALLRRAREEFENRRRRPGIFGRDMFGEPAWDMLLVLYIQDASGPRQTVGSLIKYSGTSASSAKRWIASLSERGFVKRVPHPTDARTWFVELTDKGRQCVNKFFSETVNSGV